MSRNCNKIRVSDLVKAVSVNVLLFQKCSLFLFSRGYRGAMCTSEKNT